MHGFVKIVFQPTGQTVYVPVGETALVAAREAGIILRTPCGAKGTCGKCHVVFARGAPAATPEEKAKLSPAQLSSGVRLACRAALARDAVIEIPSAVLEREAKFLLHGISREVDLDPFVEKVAVQVPPPALDDQRSDTDRLLAALENSASRASVEPSALSSLPTALREKDFLATAVVSNGRLLSVEPGDTTSTLYAAAFDIGTTTVVGMLLDLATGAEVAVAARTNPQVSFGDDVVSRIGHASTKEGLQDLQRAIVSCINDILSELASAAGVPRESIYYAAFCGNTTMTHLFLGINPHYIAQAPYVAAVRDSVEVPAAALCVTINPAGRVLTLPNVAGFVGGDTVGVMLAADFAHNRKLRLAVDIGTNGEIVLGRAGKLLAASTAAGPAFEGARIRHGMRASSGAIESVRISRGRLKVETINNEPPVGLCGTGLIDTVACLLDAGLLDDTGRLLSPADARSAARDLRARLVFDDETPRFIVARASAGAARDVFVTQRDIRELQLAKAAIAAGIQILLREFGARVDDLDEVLLAGAFGNYIRRESALRIGLLPPLPLARITQIGNAAGTGSKLVALDKDILAEARALSLETRYLELAGRPDFIHTFSESMLFPA